MDRAAETGLVLPRIYSEIAESELVRLAKNGDGSAFDELAQRYRPMCLQRARAMLRNCADAEDEVQNALLRAFLHLDDFEMRASFSTWLVSIVFRRCLMTLRRRRLVAMTSMDDGKMTAAGDFVACQVPSGDPNPEELLHRKQLAGTIERKTRCLPRSFRSALMSYWEFPATCTVMGCLGLSEPAAKSRIRRARHELRRRVEHHFRTTYSVSVFRLP